MAVQNDIVFSLEENIKRILLVANELKVSNLQFQQRVDELSEAVRVKDLEIEDLTSKYQTLRLAKTLVPSADDGKNVKFRINKMVREIDKCIALLNN
ncbi:MAG: hypothetical protein LBN37_06945 [Bacteroidales bacterium]|jgi:hypothetical protein|nr:hypothetical protein [Bacteroidales bacterium]